MQCSAKSKRTQVRCRKSAVKHKEVCEIHGGKTPKRDPKLKTSPTPFLSDFIKSTIGAELLFAINHSNTQILYVCYGKIIEARRQLASSKSAMTEKPSIESLKKYFVDLDEYFQSIYEFSKNYYTPEREIRSISLDWIFKAFGQILKTCCKKGEIEKALSQFRIHGDKLMDAKENALNPLRYDVLEGELSHSQRTCSDMIAKIPIEHRNVAAAREIINLLDLESKIRMRHQLILDLKYQYTIDDVFAFYRLIENVICSSELSDKTRQRLMSGVTNIGLGIFYRSDYGRELPYATSLGTPDAA